MILAHGAHEPKIHRSAFVAPNATLIGRVRIGKGATIWFGAVLRGDINRIEVGEGTNVQDLCVLHVERDLPCIVKRGVIVGHQATVHASVVEDGALIGIGARILNGALIGESSMVGAGSVVLEGMKIPPEHLAVGVPARVVRKLTPAEIKKNRVSAARYAALGSAYRREIAFWKMP